MEEFGELGGDFTGSSGSSSSREPWLSGTDVASFSSGIFFDDIPKIHSRNGRFSWKYRGEQETGLGGDHMWRW